MVNFCDLITEDIRLVVLRCLAEDPAYSQNESVLQAALGYFGHRVSRDRVRTELDWLTEQGFITLETVMDVKVATITKRGLDVAEGRLITSGVKRPGPRG